ncbi:LicD family-domain-containing protein [Hypoxylon fuscum]|nr:LicD family-domain-containing protein [Hypoxylon fuscum]
MYIIPPILLLLLLATTSPSTAAAVPNNDSKKKLGDKKAGDDHSPKYFHEAGSTAELGHYDGRYFREAVPYAQHRPALRHLIRSWLATARELGVETWLAHGTLLGWWWNGRVMPWDYDIDVQMPTATLSYLGRHFNRTLHDYRFLAEASDFPNADADANPGAGFGSNGGGDGEALAGLYVNKTYLLDVNPHHADAQRGNGANVIDARWIDVSNGLFIDITGLMEREAAERPGIWSCKNAHRYRTTELYPVRRTQFEGVPAAVPFAFDKILTDEYGQKSLVNTEWSGHRWMPELKEWVKTPELIEEEEEAKLEKQKDDNAVVVVVEKTVVKGA